MFRWLSRAWWRASRDVEQLELWEILRLRGTRELAARNPPALVAAAERCRDCRQADECARLIVSGRDAEIDLSERDVPPPPGRHEATPYFYCEAVRPPSTYRICPVM